MKIFYIWTHPKYGQKIEKDGFTFLGFFFTIIWLLAKKLYKPAAIFFTLCLVATFATQITTSFVESTIEKIVSMPQKELNEIVRYKNIYWQEIEPMHKDLSVNDKLELATITYASEQVKNFQIAILVIWGVVIALQLLVGFRGRAWVLKNFEKRGFDLVDKIQAHTKDDMLAKLSKRGDHKFENNAAINEEKRK